MIKMIARFLCLRLLHHHLLLKRTVAPRLRPMRSLLPPPPTEAPRSRQSLDISRAMANTRRSMDIPRPSVDMGFIATDVDLAESTFWWTQPNIPPPVFQNRKDLLFEIEESTSSKRGGKTTVSKDVYVLFADYSQTVINVRFDAKNPSDVTFEQRHEAPPSKLRQEQLEAAHEKVRKPDICCRQFGTEHDGWRWNILRSHPALAFTT